MNYVVYLRGGPEPLGVRTDNRLLSVPDLQSDIEVPVRGGEVAHYQPSTEKIEIDGTTAVVFDYVEPARHPA